MVELAGKSAIVTGSAVGLGNAYALALAKEGVNVAVCDIREEISEVSEAIRNEGVRSLAWRGDVADPAHVQEVVQGAKSEFGSIDILVNNAGVWGASTADDGLDKSVSDYDKIVGTNLKGEFLFGRAVIPIMVEQGTGGEIVNIATDHMVTCGAPHILCEPGQCPHPYPRPTSGGSAMDLYDASKWALNGLLYGWAKALTKHNIRVNALCMGATDSYMLRSFHNFNPPPEEVEQWMKAKDNAQAMIDLLKEGPNGRNAQNLNFCVGREVKLEPPVPHLYVLEDQIKTGGA